ncbi:putative Nudix hydrolase NudL [Acidipropionibacterium virtanenii]|uniref:Putative Nudix hydrolase NudL n=1 Tax=Acidipropionibacterium virtanenii TaxID=2057246 RepID=A0A344UR80_9ACTN|nr:putative Nudix hydrolase NudL [Acidipropionibacterium virtanenii]
MSAEPVGEVAGSDLGSLRTLVRSIRTTGHDAGPIQGRRAGGGRPSAVLALISDSTRPDIVLTRRNATLRYHAGQVSLPGGRAETGDTTLVETALREAHEEVGVDVGGVRVVGTMPTSHIAVSSADVTTVVASWDGSGPLGVVDPAEVASVRRVPMVDLADPANRARARHPSGFTGPAFLIPDLFVWGFTAQLLDRLLVRGGWSRQWNRSRTVEIPDDYLGGLRG